MPAIQYSLGQASSPLSDCLRTCRLENLLDLPRPRSETHVRMEPVADGQVRGEGLDDGAGVHVGQGRAAGCRAKKGSGSGVV